MSGLISREAVIERIKRMADGYSYLEVPTDYLIQELKKIEEAPSIDAVPVVRCKDCKWWDEKEDSPYGYCMAMKHGYFSNNWEIGIYRTYKGDWFCADGERKEE